MTKLFKALLSLYLAVALTVIASGQIRRQSEQDKELHDFRAAQIQIQLMQMQQRTSHRSPGHEL